MRLFRLPALLHGHLWRNTTALRGPLLPVSQKRVRTGEEVATSVAKVDDEGVRLRGGAMSFKLLKVLELCGRAETTLDRLDGPTCEVGLRSLEEHSKLRLELVGDLEKLVRRSLLLLLRCVVHMMRYFPIATPLDPGGFRPGYRSTIMLNVVSVCVELGSVHCNCS